MFSSSVQITHRGFFLKKKETKPKKSPSIEIQLMGQPPLEPLHEDREEYLFCMLSPLPVGYAYLIISERRLE